MIAGPLGYGMAWETWQVVKVKQCRILLHTVQYVCIRTTTLGTEASRAGGGDADDDDDAAQKIDTEPALRERNTRLSLSLTLHVTP